MIIVVPQFSILPNVLMEVILSLYSMEYNHLVFVIHDQGIYILSN